MKLHEEPESTGVETETEQSGVSSCTGNKDKVAISGSSCRVLTVGHVGLTLQALIKWPGAAQ